MPTLPVKREFGPTLPQLVSPRILAAIAAAVAVIAAVVLLSGAADSGETPVVVDEPVAFNLRYGKALERVDPQAGELLHLRGRDQSFTVQPLSLPAYRGDASGSLPVFAERTIKQLAARYDGFDLADEGRVRINEVPGYAIGFRARVDGRRVWGRTVMLVPDEPGAREGVTIQMISGQRSGVSNPTEVGAVGQTKLPYRSFRFGTEAP